MINLVVVERHMLNDDLIKLAKPATECVISNGLVFNIIHEHLGMSKISARCVPENLNMQFWGEYFN